MSREDSELVKQRDFGIASYKASLRDHRRAKEAYDAHQASVARYLAESANAAPEAVSALSAALTPAAPLCRRFRRRCPPGRLRAARGALSRRAAARRRRRRAPSRPPSPPRPSRRLRHIKRTRCRRRPCRNKRRPCPCRFHRMCRLHRCRRASYQRARCLPQQPWAPPPATWSSDAPLHERGGGGLDPDDETLDDLRAKAVAPPPPRPASRYLREQAFESTPRRPARRTPGPSRSSRLQWTSGPSSAAASTSSGPTTRRPTPRRCRRCPISGELPMPLGDPRGFGEGRARACLGRSGEDGPRRGAGRRGLRGAHRLGAALPARRRLGGPRASRRWRCRSTSWNGGRGSSGTRRRRPRESGVHVRTTRSTAGRTRATATKAFPPAMRFCLEYPSSMHKRCHSRPYRSPRVTVRDLQRPVCVESRRRPSRSMSEGHACEINERESPADRKTARARFPAPSSSAGARAS